MIVVIALKEAGRRPRKAGSGAVSPQPRSAVAVAAEERQRLIECCAFFRAVRFRAVEPGRYREQDLKAAAAEINAALSTRKKAKKR